MAKKAATGTKTKAAAKPKKPAKKRVNVPRMWRGSLYGGS